MQILLDSGEYPPGSLVYLSTKNLALPKGWVKNLLPKYIGLYKVVEAHTAASTITLELPPELKARQIHPTFHVNLIRLTFPMMMRGSLIEIHCHTMTSVPQTSLSGLLMKFWLTAG